MTIRAMLLRVTDNATLSVAQTLTALRDGVEQGGLCWVPILGQPPAPGRHETHPYLLVMADKRIRLVLEIHELRRGRVIGRDVIDHADEADVSPTFANVGAEAWLKVSLAPDLIALDTRVEEHPPLGQGINYLDFDQTRRTWQRVSTPSRLSRGPGAQARAPALATGSAFALPPRLRVERHARVLGIDLTGSSAKASAACILTVSDTGIVTYSAPMRPLLSDDDIVRLVTSEPWDCVALDGPRAEPRGWVGFVPRSDTAPSGVRSRSCERTVHTGVASIFFFSPRARAGVREWLSRSTLLFSRLSGLGDRLIEVFPHATFVALVNGIARRLPNPLRPKDTPGGLQDREVILAALLGQFSRATLEQGNAEKHDVVDAAAAAATALCHLVGHTVALGDPDDGGQIVVPSLKSA
jgi:predicted nuclease with RNAse H fold